MQKEIEHFRKSFSSLKHRVFIATFVIDIIFIIVYGFISSAVLTRIQERIFLIVNAAGQNAPKIAQAFAFNPSALQALRENAPIEEHLRAIVGLAIAFMIAMYLLYSLLQGLNWKMTFTRFNQKLSLKKFFLINLLWFAVFYLTQIADFFQLFASSITTGYDTAVESRPLLFNLLSLIIIYFAVFSYTLLPKNSVKNAIKKVFQLKNERLIKFLLIIVIFATLDRILFLLYPIRPVWIILGLVSVAFISWARVYIIE